MLKGQTATMKMDMFQLVRFQSDCYYEAVSLDFSAPFNLNKASNSIVPAYCKDRNYYTPAFILPRQKEYYEKNTMFEKTSFEGKISKATSLSKELQHPNANSTQLNPPIPTAKYCQICKSSFGCYFEHLKEQAHQKESKKSQANVYISELCNEYDSKNGSKKKNDKNKPIKKRKQKYLQIKQKQQSVYTQTRSRRKKQEGTKSANSITQTPIQTQKQFF